MTAINVILIDEYAVIVSDTLARAKNNPDFHVAKVMPCPHMRLAVATRGRMDAISKVFGAISVGAFDYDSTRAFLAGAYSQLGLNDVEIVVAGWSAKGPAAFVISAANTGGKVLDVQDVLISPTVPSAVADAFVADPIGQMPALLAAQAAGSRDVGGFMNVTTIGEHVIESYCSGMIG